MRGVVASPHHQPSVVRDDGRDRRGVGLLVALLERGQVSPAAGRRDVLHAQAFSGRGPAAPEGVPAAARQMFEVGEPLGFHPLSCLGLLRATSMLATIGEGDR